YLRVAGDLIRESQRVFFLALRIAMRYKDANIQTVHGAIVNALRPFLYEKTDRKPIIIPMILTPDR
ncbi:ribonuclease J, partial [Streptococcus suis]